MWETIKAFSPIIASLLNVIVLLAVYVWTNKSKADDRLKSNVGELPSKIKEELKEWMELREIYITACVSEHTKSIETLSVKVTELDKTISRIQVKLEHCERDYTLLRGALYKDE